MNDRVVEIQELVLRLPGVTHASAERIAREVADRLAAQLPTWRLGSLPIRCDLRVTLPAGTPPDRMAEVIAAQIAGALR